ncbi:MAG TPA: hypothetical protein VN436_09290 [Holophaga sp.]|nr:hypothetical protein [Holophaga sp.]
MTPKPEDVLVRGTPIIGLCRFLDRELSADVRDGLYRRLPEPYAQRFVTTSLLASDRVPLSVVNLLTTLAAQAKGEPVAAFAERAGVYGAKEGIATVFKPFFLILSMANALEIAPMLWSRIYNAGKMKVETTAKAAAIHVTEFPGDPAVCGRATGWFRYIGTLCGATNIRSRHDRCTSKGDPECVWEFDWD